MKFPFIIITPLFISGILLQKYISLPFFIYPVLFLVTLMIWLVIMYTGNNPSTKCPLYITLLFWMLTLLTGYFVSDISFKNRSFYPEWFIKQRDVTFFGKVTNVGLINKTGFTFQLNGDSVSIDNNIWHKKGSVLCRVKESALKLYNCLSPGDYLSVKGLFYKGKEIRNPGDFDYNSYLRIQGISGIVNIYDIDEIQIFSKRENSINKLLFYIRKEFHDKLLLLHNNNTAALLKGLLLADRTDIDEGVKTDFINSGVMHVLAVSGLHVVFILLIFLFLFGRFNLWLRSLLICLGIVFYILLTGAPASVVRAGIMSLILIFAFLTNRDSGLLNGLAVSAFIILLFNPEQIYMAGFQLSYAAVLSIALIYPVLSKVEIISSIKSSTLRKLVYFLLLSISSQLGTLPFIILYFGKISLSSLPANLLVIPLTGVILGNGIFTLTLSYIYFPLAHFSSLTSDLLVELLYSITEISGGEMSFISVHHFTWFNLVTFYFFILLFIYYFPRFSSQKGRTAFVILLVINILIYSNVGGKELTGANKLSFIALDVGQGDSFLIRFPNGTTALVDAGNATISYDNGIRTVLPIMNYLGLDKIDYAFISHLDKDHFNGMLSLLQAGKINKLIKPGAFPGDSINIALESFLRKNNISFSNYCKKEVIIGNAKLYILNDNNFIGDNDKSGVLKIVYGSVSILLTGDISKHAEQYYTKDYNSFLRSTILKISHHGSKTASSEEFLKVVQPSYSIISAGYKNSYNHPAPETIHTLKSCRSSILRTDLSGAIILTSDGVHVEQVNWKE